MTLEAGRELDALAEVEVEQTPHAPLPPKDGSREQELQKRLYAEKKKEE